MEKILHHLGCLKCWFYPSIKRFSGILSGAGHHSLSSWQIWIHFNHLPSILEWDHLNHLLEGLRKVSINFEWFNSLFFCASVVSNNDKPMARCLILIVHLYLQDNWKQWIRNKGVFTKSGKPSRNKLTALCENVIPRCREWNWMLSVLLLCWLLCSFTPVAV